MSLVVFGDVSLHLGGKPIIEGLSMRVGDRDRIGLIGPNGSGKTTLLRLIAGEQTPDGGTVALQRGMRLGYLPQDVQVESGLPLLRFVVESIPGRSELDGLLEQANEDLAALDGRTDDEAMDLMMEAAGRIADLHERIGEFDTLYSEHHAKRIMAGLGFSESDYDRDMGEFSGGWKMRAVLSSLLFQQPDLLLLDEPTNHLDMPSVAWFSEFLLSYKQAFILISHDREFLNEQITTVVSYEPEGVRSYTGDYNAYERQRAEERVLLENRVRNQERERADMEQFVRRFRAKATKAAQVQSRVKKLEKMEVIDLHQDRKVMRFHFKPTERVGRVALEVDSLAKHYGETKVLSDVNLHVKRGERIALLGVNGAGKTTLLRTLAGELEATSGSYEFGHNTKVSYYAQHHAETLRKDSTVYDEVKYCAKDATHQQIRAVLGAMLFGEREIEKRVGVLSGGERARVALSQMMIDPGNVLLMDEPTNHLDLESSERLAEALGTFDGTLLFVSHNKAFIRSLANVIWLVQDGTVVRYPGTFDDYLASCRMRDETAVAVDTSDASLSKTSSDGRGGKNKKKRNKGSKGKAPASAAAAPADATNDKKRRQRDAEARKKRRKVLRPLQKRATELEARVEKLEAKLAEVNTQLSDPATYEDATKRDPLLTEVTRTQAELDVAMETWSEVQGELDRKTAELDAD